MTLFLCLFFTGVILLEKSCQNGGFGRKIKRGGWLSIEGRGSGSNLLHTMVTCVCMLNYLREFLEHTLVGHKALYDSASFKNYLERENVIIKFLDVERLVAGQSSFSLASEDETSNDVSLIILARFIPSFLDI